LGREASPSGGMKSVCITRTYIHPNPAARLTLIPFPTQPPTLSSVASRPQAPDEGGLHCGAGVQHIVSVCPPPAHLTPHLTPRPPSAPVLSTSPSPASQSQTPSLLLDSPSANRPLSLAPYHTVARGHQRGSALSARPPQALGMDAERGMGH
jgi:hypothetical protein